MDTNELLDFVSEAIAESNELNSWASNSYNRKVAVFINLDVRNTPGEDICPYVAIFPGTKLVGHLVSEKRQTIEAWCVLFDEDFEKHAHLNITEYKGVKQVERFRKHVENAIVGLKDAGSLGNANFSRIDINNETIDYFPFMVAYMTIEITEDWVAGQDQLL